MSGIEWRDIAACPGCQIEQPVTFSVDFQDEKWQVLQCPDCELRYAVRIVTPTPTVTVHSISDQVRIL